MAKVKVEVVYSDKDQKKVEKGVKSLQQRMEEFSKSNFQVALVGQAALEVGNKLTAAAKAAYAFAQAGAATSGVAKEFQALDSAIEQSKLRMQESAARFLVNSGAMEITGDAADNLSNTFNVLENVLSSVGPVVQLVQLTMTALNAPVTALSAGVDYLGETFSLSAEKGELFADSFKRINDAFEKGMISEKFKELSNNIKESFSEQATAAQIEAIAKTLVNMTKSGVDASDVQVILGDQILAVSGSLKDYEANILRVVEAVKENSGETLQAKATAYQAASALNVLSDAAKTTAFEFGKTKKPMVDFNAIGGAVAGTILEGSNMLGKFLGSAQKHRDELSKYNREIKALSESTNVYLGIFGIALKTLNEAPTLAEQYWNKAEAALKRYADRLLQAQEKSSELAATGFLKGAVSGSALGKGMSDLQKRYRDLTALQHENQMSADAMYAAQMAGMNDTIAKMSPLATSVAQTMDTVAETGWFSAAVNAAIQTGFGIAKVFTAPWESATHFAAAAQFIIAQSVAGSKGGGKGASSGAASAGAGAAAPATRPPSELDRGGRGGPKSVVLNVDGRRLGEESVRGANAAMRYGTARLDPSVIGSAGWRDRI